MRAFRVLGKDKVELGEIYSSGTSVLRSLTFGRRAGAIAAAAAPLHA